jgi:hypothetical protein
MMLSFAAFFAAKQGRLSRKKKDGSTLRRGKGVSRAATSEKIACNSFFLW